GHRLLAACRPGYRGRWHSERRSLPRARAHMRPGHWRIASRRRRVRASHRIRAQQRTARSRSRSAPQMNDALLIRRAGQLLTLRGPDGPRRGAALAEVGLISDGAVLVRNGSIEAAGPAAEVEQLAAEIRDVREIDAAGRVVMPGFVDSHTHLVY